MAGCIAEIELDTVRQDNQIALQACRMVDLLLAFCQNEVRILPEGTQAEEQLTER